MNKISIKILGTSPEAFSLSDLAPLLKSINDAIISATLDTGEVNKADIGLSLTRVENGSLALEFSPKNPVVHQGYDKLLLALNHPSPKHARIYTPIREMQKVLKRTQTRAQFFKGPNQVEAEISDACAFPEQTGILKGETSIHGKLIKIGGNMPKATIEHFGERVSASLTASLAKKLSPYLYSEVSAMGIATWDAGDFKILDFEITSFEPKMTESISESFKYLREKYGETFSNIEDPVAYQRSLR